ncbi:MAG: hypothetical protein U0746_15610 [Gemmataceae bacterium]
MIKKQVLLATVLGLSVCGALQAGPGDWERIGRAGDWKGTIAGAVLKGRIYTVEREGGLYETEPSTGQWRLLATSGFSETAFMFAVGSSLYTIETNGNLYRVDPASGRWEALGSAGNWKGTIAGVAVADFCIMTAEASGALYATDTSEGLWLQRGKADFASTAFMFFANDWIYTLETGGSLYRVNPADGRCPAAGEARPSLASSTDHHGSSENDVKFQALAWDVQVVSASVQSRWNTQAEFAVLRGWDRSMATSTSALLSRSMP